MLAVPNPRYGQITGPPTDPDDPTTAPTDQHHVIYTYRPWSHEDRKNVLKDVRPLNEGYQQWHDDVESIRHNWGLNGHEMLQVFQDLLGLRFARVRGTYTGNDANGALHAANTDGLTNDLNGVFDRIRTELAPRPNYGKIGEVKQKEAATASDFLDRLRPVFRQHSGLNYEEGPDTPYQQQLKNAFLNGLLPKVRAHVDKHWVTQNTGSLPDALQYAEHAVKVHKQKEKGGVFTVDPGTGFIAFSGEHRRYNGGQNKGKWKGKGKYRGKERKPGQKDTSCYICGKEGHFARECRHRKKDDSDNEDNRHST